MNAFESQSGFKTWSMALLLSISAAGCGDPILGTGGLASLAPTVIAVTPDNNATGVSAGNPGITATFSEPMAPISGDASFTLTCAAPCVNPTGSVALDPTGRIASYTLTPATTLEPGTLYTVTITGARSLATGLALASPYVWRFTTADTARPRVTSTVPATSNPGPTGNVPVGTAISASFSEDMAPASITADGTFTLSCPLPCVAPEGSVSYVAATRTAVFTPESALAAGTTYTATISTAATDLAGNALAGNQAPLPAASNYVWTFTTQAPPTVIAVAPFINASNVPINNTLITAEFSEPVAPITGNASFTVTCLAPCTNPTGTVTLDGGNTIATYAVTSGSLEPFTTYTATVTGASSLATGLAMTSPYSWQFTTGAAPDTTRPRVTFTVPVTSNPGPTTGVATNTAITAAFTEDMAPASITAAGTFTLSCSAPCVAPGGSVSYVVGSRTAVFTPAAPLAAATTYTATVTTAATDLAGNALAGNQAPLPAASNYVWSFTTGAAADTTRPRVTSTVPATSNPGPTTGVSVNTAITAVFTENMAPASITAAGTFTVTCSGSCVSPTGLVTYVVGSRTAVFTPAAPLAANTTYTARITTAARDLAGNRLAGNQAPLPAASNYIWTFTTGAAPDAAPPTVMDTNPPNVAIGICVNQTINASFSEPMNSLTITTATFTLEVTGGALVTGIVAYDALTDIATFNPGTDLIGTPPTNYTVTIKGGPSGVKDLAGNALAVDKVTTFTTNASTCATAPALGAAAPFGIFGGSATVTNDGLDTVINGDVGVNAASTTVTGLRDSGGNVYTITPNNNGLVNGLVYTLTAPPGSVAGEAVTQARNDAQLAFDSISPANLPGGIDMSSLAQCPSCGGAGGGNDELGGRTLPPGVYLSAAGTFDLSGPARGTGSLTLDAGGDANAVWVFQTAAGTGTLNVGLTGPATPAVAIKVLLINGAQAKNVFWYVPAGANIGTGSTMVGTMLADASITFSTTGGSPPTAVITTLNGRAIALTAAVTMTNTVVNVPAP